MTKLTTGRLFTLKQLAIGPDTSHGISRQAYQENINQRPSGISEWADPHLKWARDMGYAEYTGKRFAGSRIHRITDAGRAAIKEAGE